MKFIKRLLKLAVVLLLLAVAAGAVLFVRSRQQPVWYARTEPSDPARAAEAARRAQNKLLSTQEWAAARTAAELRVKSGVDAPPASPAATRPVLSVTLTEEELNAVFQKWKAESGWEQLYSRYLSNPAIVLHDGRLILAGTVKELDRVVSLHFNPTLQPATGRLSLELESVMAGRLPMPQGLFESYRTRLRNRLAQQLPPAQAAARLQPDGSVNDETVEAAMGQLLVAVLDRQTVEPVLFLKGNSLRNVPVRMVGFTVEGDSVTLGVEMLTPDERAAWIERLRGTQGTRAARIE